MTHSHSFDPREETPNAARQAAAQRSTWVSVGVNIALSITQMLVGLWAGSQALVADAVHSLSDLVSDFVVLFANRPFWRWQTRGSFNLGLNAILNWNHLEVGR